MKEVTAVVSGTIDIVVSSESEIIHKQREVSLALWWQIFFRKANLTLLNFDFSPLLFNKKFALN